MSVNNKIRKLQHDLAEDWAEDKMTIIHEFSTGPGRLEEEPFVVFRETLEDIEEFTRELLDLLWVKEKGINC